MKKIKNKKNHIHSNRQNTMMCPHMTTFSENIGAFAFLETKTRGLEKKQVTKQEGHNPLKKGRDWKQTTQNNKTK